MYDSSKMCLKECVTLDVLAFDRFAILGMSPTRMGMDMVKDWLRILLPTCSKAIFRRENYGS